MACKTGETTAAQARAGRSGTPSATHPRQFEVQHNRDVRVNAQLRELRLELAKKEKVPPYIVFSDKTLAQMCLLKPRTKAKMLEVSGVGEFKYEKYGERFLACVREALRR